MTRRKPRLQQVAAVAPSTVTKVSKGAVAQPRAARAAEVRPRTSRVATSSKADPLAWATALDLAGGDARRLVVESYTQVLVR